MASNYVCAIICVILSPSATCRVGGTPTAERSARIVCTVVLTTRNGETFQTNHRDRTRCCMCIYMSMYIHCARTHIRAGTVTIYLHWNSIHPGGRVLRIVCKGGKQMAVNCVKLGQVLRWSALYGRRRNRVIYATCTAHDVRAAPKRSGDDEKRVFFAVGSFERWNNTWGKKKL